MSTTTSNQGHGVASTTSDHVAKTDGPTDVNLNPPATTPVPHQNDAPTPIASEHTTAKTTISGGNVIREGDAIGPGSGPPHGDTGAGGGDGSHTHLQEAKVTKGSPNVQAEGKPVAREGDKTTQNHGNTNGQVQGSSPQSELAQPPEDKKKACSLVTTKIKCLGAGTNQAQAEVQAVATAAGGESPPHNREAGKDKLLEVVAPDKVELKATRINAKEASKGPECEMEGKHTKWVVTKRQTGKVLKEQTFDGDGAHILDESWFSWNLPGVVTSDGKTSTLDRRRQYTTDEAKRAVGQKNPVTDSNGTIRNMPNQYAPHAPSNTAGMSKGEVARQTAANYENARHDAAKRRTGALNDAQDLAKFAVDLAQFIRIMTARLDPVEVSVEALACSGAEKYTVRSLPGGNAEFTIDDNLLNRIKAGANALERFCKIFQKVASLAGLPASFGMKICVDPEVELECEWKELKADRDEKYKINHVDLAWEVTFRFGILWGYQAEFAVPLAFFLNFFAPGAGNAVNTAMNWIGLEANVGVEIDFKLMPALWGKREVDEPLARVGGGVGVKLEVFFRLKVKWKTWLEVSGGCLLDFDIKGGADIGGTELTNFECKVGGEIKVGFKGSYRIDLWWWSKADSFTYFPEQCKVNLPEMKIKPFASVKA